MKNIYFNLPDSDLDTILERTSDVWDELRGGRVFITGGTGFFGRWLLGSLMWANKQLGTKIQTVIMTRDPKKFQIQFPEVEDPLVTLHPGDLRYSIFPSGEFSHILHVATDSKFDNPSEHLQILDGIVGGTRRLLDFAAHRAGTRRFLYVSSGAVYGTPETGMTEISEDFAGAPSPTESRALIGNAKRIAEQMCTLYHHQFGLDTKIARCFSFVGPHLPLDAYFAMGNFIRDACEAKQIRVGGDGSPVRSYLYAADLTIWLLRILKDGIPNRHYNVGSDQSVSMKELAFLVQKTVAPSKPVVIANEGGHHNACVSSYVPSVQRARIELGLEVWTSLEEGIKRTSEWHQTYGKKVLSHSPAPPSKKTFVVDIDGVLATITPGNDYNQAEPLSHNIREINRLYEAGHRIILFTARGTMTGLNWREVTEEQMRTWGLNYHELHFGKPAGDYYIDDRMLPLEGLAQLTL